VTKIKNFRVNLRAREMARWLKKERGLETTPELELQIQEIIKESKKWVMPAAVYTTLTRQTAEKTTSIPLPPDAVALSLTAVSIGPALEAELKNAAKDPQREMLLAALAQEALGQSLHFTVRLIGEQAEAENCLMSSPVSVPEVPVAASLATLLGVARIGVEIDAASPELPPHVRVSHWFWTPVPKGSSRRAEPAGRAEKVPA